MLTVLLVHAGAEACGCVRERKHVHVLHCTRQSRKAKSDPLAVDEEGHTARVWAGKRGHLAIETLLKNAEKAT